MGQGPGNDSQGSAPRREIRPRTRRRYHHNLGCSGACRGGAAFIFGRNELLADCVDALSYTSDTPDFWRREGEFYPRHGGRFTGEPAYFKHVLTATRAILDKTGLTPADFRFAVFHMPNGKFPLAAGTELGFTKKQMETGW